MATCPPIELRPVLLQGVSQLCRSVRAERLVERAGGNAVGSISGRTDLLVSGEKAGSKLGKAQELGIEVMDEATFIQKLELVLP